MKSKVEQDPSANAVETAAEPVAPEDATAKAVPESAAEEKPDPEPTEQLQEENPAVPEEEISSGFVLPVSVEVPAEEPEEKSQQTEEAGIPIVPPEGEASTSRVGEYEALLEAHPELHGQFIPNEVFDSFVKDGKPLLASYDAWLIAQMRTELETLRNENQVLRQNAENAAKAPVGSLTSGGSPAQEPADLFLRILGS